MVNNINGIFMIMKVRIPQTEIFCVSEKMGTGKEGEIMVEKYE